MELREGFEPPTCGVQNPSGTEEDNTSNTPPINEHDDLEDQSE